MQNVKCCGVWSLNNGSEITNHITDRLRDRQTDMDTQNKHTIEHGPNIVLLQNCIWWTGIEYKILNVFHSQIRVTIHGGYGPGSMDFHLRHWHFRSSQKLREEWSWKSESQGRNKIILYTMWRKKNIFISMTSVWIGLAWQVLDRDHIRKLFILWYKPITIRRMKGRTNALSRV